MRRPRSSEIVEGKRHEVFKPRLSIAALVSSLTGGAGSTSVATVQSNVATPSWLIHQSYNKSGQPISNGFFATDQESTVEPEASSRPCKGTLRETEHSSNCLRQIPRSVRPPSPDRCMAKPRPSRERCLT